MTRIRTAAGLMTASIATAIVLGGAPAASAAPGDLAPPGPPPAARSSVIDIVNDFLYCSDAYDAALDQMYPSGFVFFDCMRGGAPGSNG